MVRLRLLLFPGFVETLKRHKILMAAAALIPAVAAVIFLIFLIRAPVLVVTDAPFAAIYGQSRLKREQASASRALFRRVKPVLIADGASPDILIIAINKSSRRPFCVLFPRRHAPAAERYHEQHPKIRSIVLGGYSPASDLPRPDGSLYVYGTDRDIDLYRAGLLADILAGLRRNTASQAPVQRIFALWQDHSASAGQSGLFSRGVRERNAESAVIFVSSTAEMPESEALSCVVLAGAGAEFLEKGQHTPIIMFSWLDPAMAPQEIAVLFDDSPWGLAVPAVRMAGKKQKEGKIPSKILVISGNIADNGIFRMLRKAAKKHPDFFSESFGSVDKELPKQYN